MAIPGFLSLNKEHRQYGRFAAAAVAGTWLLGGLNVTWWGDYRPQARFLVPILPILVAPLAVGLRAFRRSAFRWGANAMLLWSAAMTAMLLAEPTRLWSTEYTDSGLPAAIPVLRALFPTFVGVPIPWLHAAVLAVLVGLLMTIGIRQLRRETVTP